MTIDITGINKAELLAALYNGTSALGLGRLHDLGRDMTAEEAQAILDQSDPYEGSVKFDYISGRPIKITFRGDELFGHRVYNRDSLVSCESIVDALKKKRAR